MTLPVLGCMLAQQIRTWRMARSRVSGKPRLDGRADDPSSPPRFSLRQRLGWGLEILARQIFGSETRNSRCSSPRLAFAMAVVDVHRVLRGPRAGRAPRPLAGDEQA